MLAVGRASKIASSVCSVFRARRLGVQCAVRHKASAHLAPDACTHSEDNMVIAALSYTEVVMNKCAWRRNSFASREVACNHSRNAL